MFRSDTAATGRRKAAVVLVHGFSEHHERCVFVQGRVACVCVTRVCRYSHVIQQLSSSGYVLHCCILTVIIIIIIIIIIITTTITITITNTLTATAYTDTIIRATVAARAPAGTSSLSSFTVKL